MESRLYFKLNDLIRISPSFWLCVQSKHLKKLALLNFWMFITLTYHYCTISSKESNSISWNIPVWILQFSNCFMQSSLNSSTWKKATFSNALHLNIAIFLTNHGHIHLLDFAVIKSSHLCVGVHCLRSQHYTPMGKITVLFKPVLCPTGRVFEIGGCVLRQVHAFEFWQTLGSGCLKKNNKRL